MKRRVFALAILGSLLTGPVFAAGQGTKESLLKSFDFDGYPKPGPTELYKGKLLVGSTYPDVKNGGFFEGVKIAINLTEQLPANLRKGVEQIKVIIYDPPSKHRPKNDAFTNTTGVYTVGPNLFQQAPVILYRNPKWVAPVDIAYSLVGNGVSAARHQLMMDIAIKMKQTKDRNTPEFNQLKAKFDELKANLLKTDQAVVDKYRCAPMIAIFNAMKVWETNPVKRDTMARDLKSRKCI